VFGEGGPLERSAQSTQGYSCRTLGQQGKPPKQKHLVAAMQIES
jgi:hypothetical protein